MSKILTLAVFAAVLSKAGTIENYYIEFPTFQCNDGDSCAHPIYADITLDVTPPIVSFTSFRVTFTNAYFFLGPTQVLDLTAAANHKFDHATEACGNRDEDPGSYVFDVLRQYTADPLCLDDRYEWFLNARSPRGYAFFFARASSETNNAYDKIGISVGGLNVTPCNEPTPCPTGTWLVQNGSTPTFPEPGTFGLVFLGMLAAAWKLRAHLTRQATRVH